MKMKQKSIVNWENELRKKNNYNKKNTTLISNLTAYLLPNFVRQVSKCIKNISSVEIKSRRKRLLRIYFILKHN